MIQLRSKHVFALVTGASRGFGRRLAAQFLTAVLPQAPASVTLNLHGSPASQARLEELEAALRAELADALAASATVLHVNTLTLDLQAATLDSARPLCTRARGAERFDVVFLFSNAGVWKYGRTDGDGIAGPHGALSATLAVNTVGAATVLSAFLQAFPTNASSTAATPQRVVVYVTSRCAIKPVAGAAAYCASKAAGEMAYRVAAVEDEALRVLLYAPGPMRTDMMLGRTEEIDTVLREWAVRNERENLFIDVDGSAATLVRLVLDDAYESGQHIDVRDVQ